jgi:hypothetical protein
MRRSHIAVLTIVTSCLAIAGGAIAVAQAQVQVQPQNRQCLHDENETRENRTRREKAVELADDINRAQGIARRLARPGQAPYRPLEELFNVPAPPNGFRVQLNTDGTTYSLSIKDTRDPCRYAVFSDQSMDIYEAVPTSPSTGLRLLTSR